jgi:hypothetical protein
VGDEDIIAFRASIPPIKSAILISGDGNGGSLKLDIPEVEGNIFAELYRMRRHELIVTIALAKPTEQPTEAPKVRGWKEPKLKK